MSDDRTDDESQQVHYESGIPIIDARLSKMERKQAEDQRREQEYKDRQIRLNKALVFVTAALVASAVVTGGLQLWYMHRQWKLTSAGLSKMGDQVWVAKDAANAAKEAADISNKLRIDNQNSFLQTLGQMRAQTGTQGRAADAASNSAKIAKDALIASNRPWIGVDPDHPIVVDPLYIVFVGPAELGCQRSLSASGHVTFGLWNFGNSTAVRIAFPTFQAITTSEPDSPETLESVNCSEAENASVKGIHIISLMPKAPTIVKAEVVNLPQKPICLQHIWVLGCIVYQDTLKGPIHHTRVIMHSRYIAPPPGERAGTQFTLWESDAD